MPPRISSSMGLLSSVACLPVSGTTRRQRLVTVRPISLAQFGLEFCGYFCQENNDEKDMLKLLYQSLRALESPAYKNELVRAVFELKAITINGEGPSLFSCIHCHSREELDVFSARRGGVFCDNCGMQVQGRHILSDTLYTMQYIVSADITKLYTFAVSDDVLEELRSIMKEYLSIYVHHDFKSAAFL